VKLEIHADAMANVMLQPISINALRLLGLKYFSDMAMAKLNISNRPLFMALSTKAICQLKPKR